MVVLHSQILFGDDSGSVNAEVLCRSGRDILYLIHNDIKWIRVNINYDIIPDNYINSKITLEPKYIVLYGNIIETFGNFKYNGDTYYIWYNTLGGLEYINSKQLMEQPNIVKNFNLI